MKKSKAELRGCRNPDCGAPYDPDNWTWVTNNRTGKRYPGSYCKACAGRNQRRYYEDNHERLAELKKARAAGDDGAVAALSRRRMPGERRLVKRCPKCKQPKLVRDFGYTDLRPGQEQSWCKLCRSRASNKATQARRLAECRPGEFLLLGCDPTADACPAIPQAYRREYPGPLGLRTRGWFVHLPRREDLQSFRARHPAEVVPAPGNGAWLALRLLAGQPGSG